MDSHDCWRIGIPSTATLPTGQLLTVSARAAEITIFPHIKGSTLRHCLDTFRGSVVVQRAEHFVHFSASQRRLSLQQGSPLLGQLSVKQRTCRSKTTFMINHELTPKAGPGIDQTGLGLQCLEPTAVNLGLPVYTGWGI